jgi:hypothetical protein
MGYPDLFQGDPKESARCKNCADGIELRETCFPGTFRWEHVYYNSLGRIIKVTEYCPNPHHYPRAEPMTGTRS